MTTTAVRTAVSDWGVYPSQEQRRDALLALAERVSDEQGRACQEFTTVLPLIVPALAASLCRTALASFDELVHAVSERSRFDGNPSGWLDEHDMTQREYDRADEQTLMAVDVVLDELMGKSPVVSR